MIKTFRFENDTKEFSANTYVVGEKNGPCVVIDIGSTNDRVINYIKENHTTCIGILLTHGHYDHIRGVRKLLEHYNCTVFLDEKEDEMMDNPRLNGSTLIDGNENALNLGTNVKYLVDDEDEISFYGGLLFFKVIETPFHTDGSVCYLYEKENALFTGDTLFKGSIGRTDLPGGKTKLIRPSLDKLKKLDPKLIVYPGHGDTTSLEKELKENIYLNGGYWEWTLQN